MPKTTGRITVIGFYDDRAPAEEAARALIDAGVDRNNISLVARDIAEGVPQFVELQEKTTDGSTLGENVAGGAAVGGIAGYLLGIATLTIPGLGALVALGPIAGLVAGATVGAAGGGIIGAIKDSGVPDDEANFYEEGLRRGGSVVLVDAWEHDSDRIRDILEGHGAVDIDEKMKLYASTGWDNPVMQRAKQDDIKPGSAAVRGITRVYMR
jgi:hypothetical protein